MEDQRAAAEVQGDRFSLAEVLAHADHNCKTCYGRGTVEVHVSPEKTQPALCGCAARRHARSRRLAARAAEEAAKPSLPLPVVNEREVQRARGRIERLSRDLHALQAELAEREERVRDRCAPHEVQAKDAAARLEEKGARYSLRGEMIARKRERIAALKAELTAEDAALRELWREANAISGEAAKDAADVAAAAKAIAAERQAFDEKTAGLRREIEKMTRRLATARGYNPEAAA